MMPLPRPSNKFIQLPKASNHRTSLPKPFRSNNDVERGKSEGPPLAKNHNSSVGEVPNDSYQGIQPVLKEKKKTTDSLSDIAQSLYE